MILLFHIFVGEKYKLIIFLHIIQMKTHFKHIILCLFFNFYVGTFSVSGQADIQVTEVHTDDLPSDIQYEGSVSNAWSWTDDLGDHLLLTTETGIHLSPKFDHENEGLDAEIFAYHFIITDDNTTQTWKIYDYIRDCPVDIEATFISNTTKITDLNEDGVAEIWLMYKTACRGDVSPSDMKLIMYEGTNKYAMRGQNKVQLSDNEYYGGDYTFDRAFKQSTKAFKNHAKAMWEKNILQTWE